MSNNDESRRANERRNSLEYTYVEGVDRALLCLGLSLLLLPFTHVGIIPTKEIFKKKNLYSRALIRVIGG